LGRSLCVVVVSVDGLRPDAITPTGMPVLTRMIREGAYCPNAQTIRPANTLPAHTSMLTGLTPKRHGIDFDDFDPERPYVEVPTVLALAKRSGVQTAMFYAKPKFRTLAEPGTVSVSRQCGYASRAVMKAACKLVESNRPGVLVILLPDLDSEGHAFGWMNAPYLRAARETDSLLGMLLSSLDKASILPRTTIVVTADHGGHKRSHGTRLPEDMTIPWLIWGHSVRPGVRLSGVGVVDTSPTILSLLGLSIPAGWEGQPVEKSLKLSVFADRPSGFHAPAAAPSSPAPRVVSP